MKKAVTHSLKHRAAALGLVALTLGGVSAVAADKPVATVNGVAIPQTLVDAYAKHRPQGSDQKDAIVDELVAQELLVQEAKKHGIDKKPEVKAEMEVLERGVFAGNAIKAYIDEHPISEAEMKAEYNRAAPNMAREEYKARHILLKTEDEAKAVIKELEKGADFATLAKSKSTGPSASKGGDLGWFSPVQMVKPFADAVTALKKGAYSTTPVQTQFGWHVILLEDSRTKPAPTYDAVKPQIATFLQQKMIQEYIEGLKKKAKVVK